MEALRADLSKARTLMLFRMNRVLSPEQRSKLNEMQKAQTAGAGEPPGPRPGK